LPAEKKPLDVLSNCHRFASIEPNFVGQIAGD
jgi:hypothetical protein